METGGALPAGSGRALRLDPFTLPVRFPARDAGADGQMRQIELDRDRVVLRRAVQGMRMKIRLAVDAFVGVTLVPAEDGGTASIILDHADAALSVPLMESAPADEAALMWRAWGRVLGVSLWQRDASGDVRQVSAGHRVLQAGDVIARRRRRSSIRKRRPSILMRRKPGRHIGLQAVHRGEREIIARN
jgi:hypothetical protein